MGAMNVVKPLAFMSRTRRSAFSLLPKLPSCTTKLPRDASAATACADSVRRAGVVATAGVGAGLGTVDTDAGGAAGLFGCVVGLVVTTGSDGAVAASPGT